MSAASNPQRRSKMTSTSIVWRGHKHTVQVSWNTTLPQFWILAVMYIIDWDLCVNIIFTTFPSLFHTVNEVAVMYIIIYTALQLVCERVAANVLDSFCHACTSCHVQHLLKLVCEHFIQQFPSVFRTVNKLAVTYVYTLANCVWKSSSQCSGQLLG